MPEYHRGKARSPYRKRFFGVNLNASQEGVKVQTALPSPTSGTVETKSWRGHAIIRGAGGQSTETGRANGWVGWYRGQVGVSQLEALPAGTFLAQSECFGVKPWTMGYNDLIIPMELVGVTLAVAEFLVFVFAVHFEASNTAVLCDGSFLYAEREVPA